MIRMKFFYSDEEYRQALDDKIICEYEPALFMHIVNEFIPKKDKTPPFRDEDSVKLIYEGDHVKFVKDDWYSIAKSRSRSCITALSDYTQYALTVIHNSRHGEYTSFKEYISSYISSKGNTSREKYVKYVKYVNGIWSRLADLSIDILIFVKVYEAQSHYRINFPYDFESGENVMVENYRYEGNETNAYLVNDYDFREKMIKDGKLYIPNDISEFYFSWYKDFGKLIEAAESLSGKRYKRGPVILNIREFVSSLFISPDIYGTGYYYAESFITKGWDDKEECIIYPIDWLERIEFHIYMEYIPIELIETKYPVYLVMKKNKLTQECIVKTCGGLKYPTISEAMMEKFVWLTEEEKADHELLVIVIDTYILKDANELKKALWAFKNYENIMELYDGAAIMDVFVDFIKQPFEDGLVTFEKEESDI